MSHKPTKEQLTESGKILRNLRGIRTRSGVARAVGISYTALYYYENGERNPNGRVKQKLADYYGVKPQDIFLFLVNT